MNFVEKSKNEIVIRFKDKKDLYLNTKNLLGEGWPMYESWVNDVFVGHWELIPNKLIGVNPTNEYKYWTFLYNMLIVFDINHIPRVIFEKDGDDFKGHQIDNFDIIYHLKRVET